MRYHGRKVLVTGGLGFIGSNLVIRLAELGADVTVLDASLPGCGANSYNLEPVRDAVRLLPADLRDTAAYAAELSGFEVVFNLAGEISHVHSMDFPERDLDINALAQLRFVLALRDRCPGVRVVYAGTRQIYGTPKYLPLDESHPVQPVDFNGVHKYAATLYHLMLTRTGELDAIVLRLTNIYGPRMSLKVPCQGFLSTFLRRLLCGQGLEIFGDGKQLRDPIYVDDAVDAFLLAGQVRKPASRTYNVGGGEALSVAQIAEIGACAAGGVPLTFRPFPEERKAIDIGSYYTDSSLIERELGWKPRVRFEDGIVRTLEFYRRELVHYLDPSQPNPECDLPDHKSFVRRTVVPAV